MTTRVNSRRDFLKTGSTVFGASWVALNMPLALAAGQRAGENKQAAAAFENITAREAVVLGAIADQVIPVDESPSASEIGVVHFIDVVLGGFMAGNAPLLRQGLEDLDTRSKLIDSDQKGFAELSFEQQKKLLRSVEDTPFFDTFHFMTICGMFCMPEYGGNREHAGWDLLGFNHQHAWQPPFGYYDAAVHDAGAEGGKTDEQG